MPAIETAKQVIGTFATDCHVIGKQLKKTK